MLTPSLGIASIRPKQLFLSKIYCGITQPARALRMSLWMSPKTLMRYGEGAVNSLLKKICAGYSEPLIRSSHIREARMYSQHCISMCERSFLFAFCLFRLKLSHWSINPLCCFQLEAFRQLENSVSRIHDIILEYKVSA